MTNPATKGDEAIPVIAAVVRRGDQYLVGQRPKQKRHGGRWEFPGGKIEQGETVLEGTRRELQEELGVNVTNVGREHFAIQDPGSAFRIEFHEVEIAGEPRCLEHSAIEWATLEELLTMNLAPSDEAFVRFLAEEKAPS